MCITNEDLEKGRGNGIICRCVNLHLKRNATIQWKNWEGKKVNTVSVDDVEWGVQFEHWPKPPRDVPCLFKLHFLVLHNLHFLNFETSSRYQLGMSVSPKFRLIQILPPQDISYKECPKIH